MDGSVRTKANARVCPHASSRVEVPYRSRMKPVRASKAIENNQGRSRKDQRAVRRLLIYSEVVFFFFFFHINIKNRTISFSFSVGRYNVLDPLPTRKINTCKKISETNFPYLI